jgi:hypothetical protein
MYFWSVEYQYHSELEFASKVNEVNPVVGCQFFVVEAPGLDNRHANNVILFFLD